MISVYLVLAFSWDHVWRFTSSTVSYGPRKVLSLWRLPGVGVTDSEFQHACLVFTERLCIFLFC